MFSRDVYYTDDFYIFRTELYDADDKVRIYIYIKQW